LTVDFDAESKKNLQEILFKVNDTSVKIIDDYRTKIHFKDESIYAYAPRRFALKKHNQIREITNDLLPCGYH